MTTEYWLDRRRLLAYAASIGASSIVSSAALAQDRKARPVSSAPASTGALPKRAAPSRAFLTEREFALLDEMAEMIIPADEKSGGARAARVAEFIDQKLGMSIDRTTQQSWRDDLAEIDRLSTLQFRKGFLEVSPAERVRLLESISRNEKNPRQPGEYAFGTIKYEVAWTYYKSKVGIHDELDYQGNVLLDAFIGVDASHI